MKLKKILSLVLAGVMALCVTGCVNQHPEETTSTNESREVRLVATSPAVVQICNRLDLDLVGICQSTSDLPERYGGVTTVGMAMNPDLEIIKSLDPDYILSPATLQNALQPKYASIGVSSLFLNLKSVEGMYTSIEGLGEKFGREEEAAVMLEEFDSFMTEFAEKNAGKESPKVLVLMGLPGSYIIATDNSYVGSLVKLAGGTNVIYAPAGDTAVTSRANLTTASVLTPDLIDQAATALKAQNADAIGESYVAIVHPYVAYDLRRNPEWIDVHKYSTPENIYTGEIGKPAGVRFLETSEAKIWTGTGCPTSLAVFGTLVLAAHAYAVTEVEGGGLQHIVKQLGEGEDPLNQRASVGWKAIKTAERLCEQYMVRIESVSPKYSAKAKAN